MINEKPATADNCVTAPSPPTPTARPGDEDRTFPAPEGGAYKPDAALAAKTSAATTQMPLAPAHLLDQLRTRYHHLVWTANDPANSATAYLPGDDNGAEPLITITTTGPDEWMLSIHVMPSPDDVGATRLENDLRAKTRKLEKLFKELNAYFASLMAAGFRNSVTTNTNFTGPVEANEAPTEHGPLDNHHRNSPVYRH